MNCSNLNFKIGRFRITSIMKNWLNISIFGFLIDGIHQLCSCDLFISSHITLIRIENIKLISFIISFFMKLYSFTKAVKLRRISLLNDYFYNEFSLEVVSSKHRDILNYNLDIKLITSCLLLRSTLGYIF